MARRTDHLWQTPRRRAATARPRLRTALAAVVAGLAFASCSTGGTASDGGSPVSTAGAAQATEDGGTGAAGGAGGAKGGPRISPSGDPDDRLDDQWHDVAGRVGPDPAPDSEGAAACREQLGEPLAALALVGDPVGELRRGEVPSVFGPDDLLADVVEFDSFEDYPDPSTPADLDALLDAWTEAGFAGGVAAKTESGGSIVMATAVEFASPESARTAVTVHLDDLCHGAVRSQRHPDGAGLSIARESGAVRSVRAVDRFEISLFVCSCVGATDADRAEAMEQWRAYLDGRWSGPALPTSPST